MLPKSASSLPEATETHPLRRDPPARARAGRRAPELASTASSAQFLQNLNFDRGVALSTSSVTDRYLALAHTVRDYLMARWLEDQRRQRKTQAKGVSTCPRSTCSAGSSTTTCWPPASPRSPRRRWPPAAWTSTTLRQQEVEPGLGNGGLGRLAACFIDSLATMSVPSIGYGIRYEYGIFRQTFVDGQQVEQPDAWLALGSPWEFPHPEAAQTISFGGHTEHYDDDGVTRSAGSRRGTCRPCPTTTWFRATRTAASTRCGCGAPSPPTRSTCASSTPATTRRPSARRPSPRTSRRCSTPRTRRRRARSCACSSSTSSSRRPSRDFLDVTLPKDFDLTKLPDRVIFQLNDTHPVIAVPELMRVLVDEKGMEWDAAWAITQQCFAYTCHTLLPEALEVWSVDLLGQLLPRHLEIIYRINDDFLDEVRERFGDDELRIRDMSIIGEYPVALGSDGVPRHGRRREGQRRRRTALAAARATRCCPTSTSSSPASSRTSPTASRPGASSGWRTRALGPDHRGTRLGVGDRPRAAARAGDPRRRPRVPRPVRRGQGLEQATSQRAAARARRLRDQRRTTCSTSWSSVCTSTSGRCSTSCTS